MVIFSTYMHVLLLVLDTGQCARELAYHVFQFGVANLLLARCARCALWSITQFDGEHDQLGCHAAALIVEAHGVDTLCGRNESVFARGFLLALMHNMLIGSGDFDVHIQETAFDYLECNTYECVCVCVKSVD